MSEERNSRKEAAAQRRKLPTPVLVALGVLFLVVLVIIARFCSTAATIHVTVNGTPLSLHGAKTMDTAIRESGLPINPGDLVSLKGEVLERSEGYPFYATVNGEETTDPNRTLRDGDQITVADGKDKLEDFDSYTEPLQHTTRVGGEGPLCTFSEGSDGTIEHRVGKITGEETRKVIEDSKDNMGVWYIPDVGSDKVIALTFDEGPSEYTDEILEVLNENEVTATFFFVGEQAEQYPDAVRHASEAHHQIGSNTYDREITTSTSAEWIQKQVDDGFAAISKAMGADAEPSRIIRFPKAMLGNEMASVIDDDVDAVVGWSLDTGDWLEHGSDQVYETLMECEPGEVVVMRDGGGDRSNTVEALRKALPKLKKKGYTFVTIDELLKYPAKE